MKTTNSILKCALSLAFAGMLAAGPAFADNDNKGNKNKGKGHQQQRHDNDDRKGDHRDDGKRSEWRNHRFQDNHRMAARDYYDRNYRGSRCPPGLAKKNNGCVPPGHARKWQQGHSLPRNVTYYSVPRPLVLQLGQPPTGYQYVRVSSDILLMELATRIIVDSILDLGRS
jgi:Ni/Co efflux regulator RcnB